MSELTLRQLKIFTLIVEHGGFSRCAEHLNVSSVAISDHVKKLEERLGHKLFERHKGETPVLTEKGEQDYLSAALIMREVNKLSGSDRNDTNRNAYRILTISVTPHTYEYFINELDNIAKRWPKVVINFELNLNSVSEIEEKLADQEIDVAYFHLLNGSYHASSDIVCEEPLSIYVGKEHPLAKKSNVSVTDLSSTPAVQGAKTTYMRQVIDGALAQVGLKDYPVAINTDHFGLMLSYLHQNKGFICMHKNLKEFSVYTENLVRLSLDFKIPPIQLRRMLRPAIKYDPLVKDILNVLTQTLSSS